MSRQETLLTKEFFLEVMQGVDGRFKSIDAQFKTIDAQFDKIDTKFDRIETKFDGIDAKLDAIDTRFDRVEQKLVEHDDLLEMIASEVSGTQNTLHRLFPIQNNHEKRISTLERELKKLAVKS